MTDTLNNLFTQWWDFVDSRGVVRRIVLVASIYMLWTGSVWANDYAFAALAAGKADVGVAAIMAAITAPATMLVGYVFKSYLDSRAP